jgi:hypothetical protein
VVDLNTSAPTTSAPTAEARERGRRADHEPRSRHGDRGRQARKKDQGQDRAGEGTGTAGSLPARGASERERAHGDERGTEANVGGAGRIVLHPAAAGHALPRCAHLDGTVVLA